MDCLILSVMAWASSREVVIGRRAVIQSAPSLSWGRNSVPRYLREYPVSPNTMKATNRVVLWNR